MWTFAVAAVCTCARFGLTPPTRLPRHCLTRPIWAHLKLWKHGCLEPECAALAALHATAQQRNMLRSLHAAMELVHTPQVNRDGSCGKYDRLLHLTIAQACGNAALASAVAHLWELSDHSPVFQRLDQQPVSAQHWGVSWREHSRFVEAIVSGDTVRARHGMAHHLLSVMDRIRNNPAWLV